MNVIIKGKKMLDDDFKKIEDFLKAGGNSELQIFQDFENAVDGFVATQYADNIKEGFGALNQLIFHSYSKFETNNEDIVKDFAITIIIIKKLLTKIQEVETDTILKEEDKKMYVHLMVLLLESLKKEAESHFNFFKAFMEYIDETKSEFSSSD